MTDPLSSKTMSQQIREEFAQALNLAHDSTHYEGCWKNHWPCVLEMVLDELDRQRAEIERLTRERNAFRSAGLTATAYLEGTAPLVESAIERLRAAERAYVSGEPASVPETTPELRVPISEVRQFIAWLCGDVEELRTVEVPRIAEAWERFRRLQVNGEASR